MSADDFEEARMWAEMSADACAVVSVVGYMYTILF